MAVSFCYKEHKKQTHRFKVAYVHWKKKERRVEEKAGGEKDRKHRKMVSVSPGFPWLNFQEILHIKDLINYSLGGDIPEFEVCMCAFACFKLRNLLHSTICPKMWRPFTFTEIYCFNRICWKEAYWFPQECWNLTKVDNRGLPWSQIIQ